MNWHYLEINEIVERLNTTISGLSSEQGLLKLSEFGANELEVKKKKSPLVLFLGQFKDFMILVLIAAAIIAGITGDRTDAIIIMVIVLLNAIVGFVQEYRAEKAMDALKKIAALQAQVLRNGIPVCIPSAEIVPGDLVLLEAGNIVPADLRLVETYGLLIDESTLTGESVPSEKTEKKMNEIDLSIADRKNIAYKGTLITNGRAKGIVTATGMQTEIGLIAKLLQENETITPLQKRMSDFGKKLSYIILFICLLLFVIGLLMGEKPLNMLLVSIALAVAAIPEALPALITIALARGANRLVKKNALIRKLPAVETLGSVTYICSDKTGTLTQNKMTVVQVQVAEEDRLFNGYSILDIAMALNNDVKEGKDRSLLGDPTEIALINYFIEKNELPELKKLQQQLQRVAELPFDSDRKCMTTVHRFNNQYLIISKGAVEYITAALKKDISAINVIREAEQWALNGIRVIAFGYKLVDELPDPFTFERVETELSFAGIAGMIDPPRKEVKQAIDECKSAGIHTVMITGDHPSTASFIAKEIGMLTKNDLVMTGKELQALTDEEYDERVERVRVYARVSPVQKLNIVKALQRKNHFVSMTGDGVNDAPSLKSSDIGVAMGITGTDVSKEAADMILLDDNFATIVKAVKEGRRIYDNIRKFVKYIMTCNGAEIWTLFLAPLIGLPIPLLAIHILWINLVTDGLPGLALAGEKSEKDIMQRPPRKFSESLFSDGIAFHIVWVGLLMAGVTLGIQAWAINNGNAHWQTMIFTVLSLSQLGHVMAIRSEKEFLFKQGIFSNMPLIAAVILTFILQMGVIYLPFANKIFKTNPLTVNELLISLAAAAVVFHAVEIEKLVKKINNKKNQKK